MSPKGLIQSSKTEANGLWSMNYFKKLHEEVSRHDRTYRFIHIVFGGREFLLGTAEVGHMHTGGIVDLPFPRSFRDALLAEGLLKNTTAFRAAVKTNNP
jgi:hypothetical protein